MTGARDKAMDGFTIIDAVVAAVTTPGFFELKRGGKGSAQIV